MALIMLCGFFPARLAAAPVTLRISWWGSQTRTDRTLTVLDLYGKKTGVKFEPEFYPFADYFTKLNAQVAAADAPDIMQMGGNFRSYMDYLEVLNDYISKGTIDTRNTDKSFIGITSLEGKTIGISLGTNADAMAYDPGLFKKAGVPLPTVKWTWAEYEKAALTITQKLGIMGSSRLTENEWGILSGAWVGQYGNGEQSFFVMPYREKLNYTNDRYVSDFFVMKKKLTDAKAYPNPAQMAEIKDIEGDPIVRGQAAMTWISSNQFVALSNAAKRPLALVNSPRRTATGPLAQIIMSSQMFSVYKGSTQKEAAARFVSYFVNDVDANKVLLGERGVPIMRTVREALAPNLDASQKAIYRYLTELGKEASLDMQFDPPGWNEMRDAFKDLSEQVVFDKITPQVAAQNMKAQVLEILARAK
jgi:multiple sugar transport system substrate-binding protein